MLDAVKIALFYGSCKMIPAAGEKVMWVSGEFTDVGKF
jgi:hypothetical protein